VSLYEWLLFLHVAAAFLLVAGIGAYAAVVLAGDDGAVLSALAPAAPVLWNAGGFGTLVLGVWLTIELDAYQPWDGWIIAALVLWVVASAAAGPLSRGLRHGAGRLPRGQARLRLAVMSVATAALLIDMVYKPGV